MEENKNIEQQLTSALDNSNDKQVENIIENNPVETSKILPENSPLQNEAKEVTDGDKRTDRVDNKVIKDSIDDFHTPGGYLNQNQNGKLKEDIIDDNFFENFAKGLKSTENADKYQADNPDEINYPALQEWADSVEDDPAIAERAVAYSLDDVKDKKDFDSYKWAQQKDYDAAQAKLDRASNLMKKASEGDEFNNDYRRAAGSISFPAGAARARAEKNINVANALQNTEMDDATFAAALKDKQLIRDLKGMPIEQDRIDRIGMFIDSYRAAAANKDTKKAEQLIEENPDIAVEALPEGTNAHEEAAQIFDGDARTDEVNNERLSEDFENVDDLYNYLIDWDKVNVYGPEENHSEWENEPDFDTSYWDASMGENPLPEGERPNLHEGDEAIDKMQERIDRDEDFAGPDELPATYDQFVEPGKELALTNGNELDSVDANELASIEDARNAGFSWEIIDGQIDEAVDNDETIPEDEKEKTKKRRHKLIKLLSGNSKSIKGGSNVPSEKTDISTKQQSSNIQSAGKNILGNVGASSGVTASRVPSIKEEKKPAASGSTASKAGGGSMPVANEGNYSAVSHSNGGNMSSGSAGSGMFGKVGTLGKGGSIASKKSTLPGGESKGGSSVLQSPQGAKNSSIDMNILSLRDKIIAKSKTWPGQRLDKDGMLIVVRDDNRVFINKQLFENFIKDNPKSVQYLRQIVDKY